MPSFRVVLGALFALVGVVPTHAADSAFRDALRRERERPEAPRFVRAAFLARPAITHVTLSPTGDRIAWLRGFDDERGLWIAPADGRPARQLLSHTDASTLMWSHDGRWLFVISPTRVFALPANGKGGARVMAQWRDASMVDVMEVDPTRAAAVIVRERLQETDGRSAGWRISRIDVGGVAYVLASASGRISGFALAKNGHLAFLQTVEGDVFVTSHREADGRRTPVLRCEAMHRCTLWPRLDDEGRALFAADLGRSLRSLQRLERDGTIHTLATDPRNEADIDEVTGNPLTGAPLLLTFRGRSVVTRALDATAQVHVDRIASRYPGRALSLEPGIERWLVVERGGTLPLARYHLYDPVAGTFVDVPALEGSHPLPESAMAVQIPFDWTASDGMLLHGFLRVPAGRDPATVPLVALIHGGPWGNVAADEFGTGVSQFLVNRGYAVFEPNFRGSTGYGRDYMLAPHGDFGNGRVQRDIVEGVRALLAQGVGDAQRVGIAGASFGGYSTLLGLTWQPDLFRVGVAFVPPADFGWDLTWVGRTTEAHALSPTLVYERWMAMVGVGPGDRVRMDALHGDAPLAHAARMHRPLTIIAGGADQRVALRGVLGYVADLRRRGTEVTLLVDPQQGHSDARPLAREAGLYLMSETLRRTLGGAPEAPPDPALRDYLSAHLRLAASGLGQAGP